MDVSSAIDAKDYATSRKQDRPCTAPSAPTMSALSAATPTSLSNDPYFPDKSCWYASIAGGDASNVYYFQWTKKSKLPSPISKPSLPRTLTTPAPWYPLTNPELLPRIQRRKVPGPHRKRLRYIIPHPAQGKEPAWKDSVVLTYFD